MSDSLDDLFSSLLEDTPGGLAAAGKLPRAITYAESYDWRLHSFVAFSYSTTCEKCGSVHTTGGEVFKRVVSARSPNTVSLTRLATLGELAAHPHLPRLLEVHHATTLACLHCLTALNFLEP